jgi:hypothetical protein
MRWCVLLIAAIACWRRGADASSAAVAATTTAFPATIAVAAAGAGPNTIAAEAFAARMLAQQAGAVLGAPPSVVPPPAAHGRPQVAVGHAASVALGVAPALLAKLGDDGFVLAAVGSGSFAVGAAPGSARGALNGVYRLLLELGIQSFAPNVSSPLPASLRLPAPGFKVSPPCMTPEI